MLEKATFRSLQLAFLPQVLVNGFSGRVFASPSLVYSDSPPSSNKVGYLTEILMNDAALVCSL